MEVDVERKTRRQAAGRGSSRKTLARLLLDDGLVSGQQLDEALARQRESRGLLRDVLLELKMVDEGDLMDFLARWIDIPYIANLAEAVIEPETIDILPEKTAKGRFVLPISRKDGLLDLAMAYPLDLVVRDEVEAIAECRVRPVLARKGHIQELLNRHYADSSEIQSILGELEDPEAGTIEVLADEDDDLEEEEEARHDEAPIIKFVDLIITQAVKAGASDIHIEPGEKTLRVRYRTDGHLHEAMTPPRKLHPAIVSRIKIMADLDIAERRAPQDGRVRLRIEGKDLDIRVSTVPSIHGEKVVMRVLDKARVLVGLEELGFDEELLQTWQGLIQRPHGIILVTGPTGSGKTTSLYATLERIKSVEKNIVTIEDPVEYHLERITQIQVNPKAGITFASGLRSLFRQDPDVILIGEMRDLETCQIATRAALTGHLVFSTLHTNDAAASLTRLVDMGIDPYLISSSVVAVEAQRLVRRVCPACKEACPLEEEEMEKVRLRGARLEEEVYQFFRGVGCDDCAGKGYRGRTGIVELMVMNEPIRKLVMEKRPASAIRETARKGGMRTLWEAGLAKAIQGETTLEEISRATSLEEE